MLRKAVSLSSCFTAAIKLILLYLHNFHVLKNNIFLVNMKPGSRPKFCGEWSYLGIRAYFVFLKKFHVSSGLIKKQTNQQSREVTSRDRIKHIICLLESWVRTLVLHVSLITAKNAPKHWAGSSLWHPALPSMVPKREIKSK